MVRGLMSQRLHLTGHPLRQAPFLLPRKWLYHSMELGSPSLTWQAEDLFVKLLILFSRKLWAPVPSSTAEAQVIWVVINLSEQLRCLWGGIMLNLIAPARRAAHQNRSIVPHHTHLYLFPMPTPWIWCMNINISSYPGQISDSGQALIHWEKTCLLFLSFSSPFEIKRNSIHQNPSGSTSLPVICLKREWNEFNLHRSCRTLHCQLSSRRGYHCSKVIV